MADIAVQDVVDGSWQKDGAGYRLVGKPKPTEEELAASAKGMRGTRACFSLLVEQRSLSPSASRSSGTVDARRRLIKSA